MGVDPLSLLRESAAAPVEELRLGECAAALGLVLCDSPLDLDRVGLGLWYLARLLRRRGLMFGASLAVQATGEEIDMPAELGHLWQALHDVAGVLQQRDHLHVGVRPLTLPPPRLTMSLGQLEKAIDRLGPPAPVSPVRVPVERPRVEDRVHSLLRELSACEAIPLMAPSPQQTILNLLAALEIVRQGLARLVQETPQHAPELRRRKEGVHALAHA